MYFKNQKEAIIHADPRMFIHTLSREWDKEALQQLIITVISCAAEPEYVNQCSIVSISLKPEDLIIIEDDGRGLPVDPPSRVPKSDTPALTELLEWFMPTGIRPKEFYEEYGFLSYLTIVLNVLSESLQIDTVWQGQAYTVSCSRGDIMTPLQKVDTGTLNQGTRIRFKPDPDIFPSPAFNEQAFKIELNKLASKFPQIIFDFTA